MSDLLSQTKIYAAHHVARSSSYQSISAVRAPPQQLPAAAAAVDGWDRQTDGWTLDRFTTLAAYHVDRVIMG